MHEPRCPYCGERVLPSGDGTCPACRAALPDYMPRDSELPYPGPAGWTDNPYRSPIAPIPLETPEHVGGQELHPSHRAARLSVYAASAIVLLACWLGPMTAVAYEQIDFPKLALAVGGICALIGPPGFLAAAVGFFGGIKRRADCTVTVGAIGMLLNLGLIAAAAGLLFAGIYHG